MKMRITGNTILITGGSSGIGLALAKRFVLLQNKVIITGRDHIKLEKIKQAIPQLDIFVGDLTRKEVLHELISFIEQEYRGLNILINNAAVQYNYQFLNDADSLFKIDYEIATNLSVPVTLSALLLTTLHKNDNSAIVNVSSGLFMAPRKNASVYCATKAAIHSFSKTLRYQLESTGVKVFEIIPALVETPMTAGRGKYMISPEVLVDEYLNDFRNNRFESYIGKTKLLRLISRFAPRLADKIMKDA